MPTALPTPDHLPDWAADSRASRLQELLNRPPDQRLREYKYRFAQSVVFGLPVVALQWWGRSLGPVDADRWVSLLQALLSGWVVCVNLGMLVEGMLLLRSGPRADFVVAGIAVCLYLYSLISALHGIISDHLWYRPLLFHVCVIMLAGWTGWRWRRMSRHA